MVETAAKWLSPLLAFPLIRRIRRNHGLEHATIHMLARRVKNLRIAGRADNSGFYLYGEADTQQIWEAAEEALSRMKRGEHKWAIHPNCGTGLVTTSFLTSGAALLGLLRTKDDSWGEKLNRLPIIMLLTIGALIISQPLGLSLQEHFTTLGEVGDLEIVDITRHESALSLQGKMTVHRIHTRYG